MVQNVVVSEREVVGQQQVFQLRKCPDSLRDAFNLIVFNVNGCQFETFPTQLCSFLNVAGREHHRQRMNDKARMSMDKQGGGGRASIAYLYAGRRTCVASTGA